jgi:hypothetical protein
MFMRYGTNTPTCTGRPWPHRGGRRWCPAGRDHAAVDVVEPQGQLTRGIRQTLALGHQVAEDALGRQR